MQNLIIDANKETNFISNFFKEQLRICLNTFDSENMNFEPLQVNHYKK